MIIATNATSINVEVDISQCTICTVLASLSGIQGNMDDLMVSVEPPFPQWASLRNSVLSIASDIDPHRDWGAQDPRRTSKQIEDVIGSLGLDRVYDVLSSHLSTPLLDELFDHLWLVARKESNHIDSLHYQVVKGRAIVLNEEAKMHLLWAEDKIHIKPIPQYLLDYHFWKHCLGMQSQAAKHWRTVASGFLRSYAYLICNRSDLEFAKEKFLIPKDIDWEAWNFFIAYFRRVGDDDVAKRYLYGQMRLSRLDTVVRWYRPRGKDTIWFYEPPYWSTGPYLRSFTASLAFSLASISLVLSSMQLMLNAGTKTGLTAHTFSRFAVFVLVAIVSSWFLIFAVPFAFLLWQFQFGLQYRML